MLVFRGMPISELHLRTQLVSLKFQTSPFSPYFELAIITRYVRFSPPMHPSVPIASTDSKANANAASNSIAPGPISFNQSENGLAARSAIERKRTHSNAERGREGMKVRVTRRRRCWLAIDR